MKKFVDKIKQKWEENPLEVIVTSTLVVSTTMIVVNALSQASSRRAYVKLVDNKIKNG